MLKLFGKVLADGSIERCSDGTDEESNSAYISLHDAVNAIEPAVDERESQQKSVPIYRRQRARNNEEDNGEGDDHEYVAVRVFKKHEDFPGQLIVCLENVTASVVAAIEKSQSDIKLIESSKDAEIVRMITKRIDHHLSRAQTDLDQELL